MGAKGPLKQRMASFKKIRNVLLECLDDDVIDEEEFVLLYDLNRSKNPEFPHDNYERFDLESMDPAECKAKFRFKKADLESLPEACVTRGVFVTVWMDFACYSGDLPTLVGTVT